MFSCLVHFFLFQQNNAQISILMKLSDIFVQCFVSLPENVNMISAWSFKMGTFFCRSFLFVLAAVHRHKSAVSRN